MSQISIGRGTEGNSRAAALESGIATTGIAKGIHCTEHTLVAAQCLRNSRLKHLAHHHSSQQIIGAQNNISSDICRWSDLLCGANTDSGLWSTLVRQMTEKGMSLKYFCCLCGHQWSHSYIVISRLIHCNN